MGSAEPLIIRIILHCLCEKNVHAAHPFCPLRTNSYRQQSSCGTTSNKLPPSHAPPEIDERWADGDASRLPGLARELGQLQPDVIAATGTSETKALRAATQDIPVAFLQVADPISSGLVASIPRPGGNITGLMQGRLCVCVSAEAAWFVDRDDWASTPPSCVARQSRKLGNCIELGRCPGRRTPRRC